MKFIGIINKYSKSQNNHDIAYSYLDLSKKIIEAGGYPIQFNLFNSNFLQTKKILKKLDGVIFSGGDDYTKLEIELIKYLHKQNIKTLGICLGMQTMAVAFNGKLKIIKNHYNTYHEVNINKNSKIYEILGKEKIIVNSRHNFQVLNTNLAISGTYNDTIEIIEDKNKTFFIGIQWHPESLTNHDSKKIFEYFVNCN